MKRQISFIALFFAFLTCSFCNSMAADLQNGNFTFALANSNGTRLLVLDDNQEFNGEVEAVDAEENPSISDGEMQFKGTEMAEPNLKKYTHAIHQGKIYNIQYVGRQKATGENDGRQVPSNFYQFDGFLFKVENEKMIGADAVLLVDDSFLEKNKLVNFTSKKRVAASASLTAALKNQYKRGLQRTAGLICTFGDNNKNILLGAQFKTIGKNMLGVIAMKLNDSDSFCTLNLPGSTKNIPSVWRVDDEGCFSADNFKVKAVFSTLGGYKFLISDYGAEGIACYFLLQKDKKLVKRNTNFSLYTAPM